MWKKVDLKILMYTSSGYGGLFHYSKCLCEGLSKVGCEIILVTATDCSFESSNMRIIRNLKPMSDDLWYLKYKPLWAVDRLYRAWSNSRRRHSICEELNPDIVHLQLNIPLVDQFYVPMLSKRFTTVMTVHDVRLHDKDKINNRKSYLGRMYRSAHNLIVHTVSNREQLVREFSINPEKICVIPLGVSMPDDNLLSRQEARNYLTIHQDIPIVLFFGNLRENKGLDVLLNAMALIIKDVPEAMLLIAGRMPFGKTFDKYERLIKQLGVKANVKVKVGWIEEQEMEYYYQASDIIALPYKSFASQSAVLLQAYRYGKPVIVTNVGGLGEVVLNDKTGVVVESNAESVYSGIMKLLKNRKLYNNASSNMMKSVRDKYSWDIVAVKTKEFYDAIYRIS